MATEESLSNLNEQSRELSLLDKADLLSTKDGGLSYSQVSKDSFKYSFKQSGVRFSFGKMFGGKKEKKPAGKKQKQESKRSTDQNDSYPEIVVDTKSRDASILDVDLSDVKDSVLPGEEI